MTGVDREVVINSPVINPFNVALFFIVRVTNSWNEAVNVITHTEDPEDKMFV